MQKQKLKISNSNNGKADSLSILLAGAIVKLFKVFISFDENSLSRLLLDRFSIASRSFLDCSSIAARCKLNEGSMKARLNNSDSIPEYLSVVPMGYFKMVPQYMPRAPD